VTFVVFVEIWMVNVDISYSLFDVLFISVDVLFTLVQTVVGMYQGSNLAEIVNIVYIFHFLTKI
jgi:hypothetical protein